MQTTKMPGNRELAVAMQEKRRSSATSRHKSPRDYDRKRDKRDLRRGDW